MPNKVSIKLSATVVLMRDSARGTEFLLAKKSDSVSFLPGYWVFPGGSVDAEDMRECEQATLKIACVRESKEEVNVDIDANSLLPFAHWITPEGSPKQFSTWFYLSALSAESALQVKVDDSELVQSRWLTADQGIALHKKGLAPMLPPTLIALMRLQAFATVNDIHQIAWQEKITTIKPMATFFNDELTMLYPGDAAYGLAVDCEGARHRCTEESGVWSYVNTMADESLLD